MQGVVRFFLFTAIIALLLTGFYANSLRMNVARLDTEKSALVTERDSLKMKLDAVTKESETAKASLTDAQSKIASLEAEAEAAKQKPRSRSR